MSDDSAPDKLRCPNCGTEYARHGYIVPRQDKPYYCLECALPPEFLEELEQLADEWEVASEELSDAGNPLSSMWNQKRSDQLRDLIAEYETNE